MKTEQHQQTVATSSKPGDSLTYEVVSALAEAQLIRPQDAERLTSQLLAGSLKAEDWLVIAENAVLGTSLDTSEERT